MLYKSLFREYHSLANGDRLAAKKRIYTLAAKYEVPSGTEVLASLAIPADRINLSSE